MPERAMLARVVRYHASPDGPARELRVHLWLADPGGLGEACCFLHIDILQERPLPVTGIDNMAALESALAVADSLIRTAAAAGVVSHPAGGPYRSTWVRAYGGRVWAEAPLERSVGSAPPATPEPAGQRDPSKELDRPA